MDIKEEERRWKTVIEQYKTEIGRSLVGINTNIGKGYLKKDESGIALTERGIGYVEATLSFKEITENMIDTDPTTKEILGLFESTDDELDVTACSFIYARNYKNKPTEESIAILKGLLTNAAIPKSE